jgi:hypothetical protein
MRASDERRIKRDHVHEHAEAELFLEQPPGDFQLGNGAAWIEEKFRRIVARFAVDIDGAREIGRHSVI